MKNNKKIKKTTWIMGSLYIIAMGFATYTYYDYILSYTKGVKPEFGDDNSAKEIYFNADEIVNSMRQMVLIYQYRQMPFP